jgi:dihydrofolate synthase/folylpolyglutamate synthase
MYDSVKEAYRKALEESGENDFIFVGGSSYIVADLLS